MKVKCPECNNEVASYSRVLFRGLPREGVTCGSCSALLKVNYVLLIVSFVIGGFVNLMALSIKPELASYYLQYGVTFLVMAILLRKPLVSVNGKKQKPKIIKWYFSPLVLMVPMFIVVLYFMFR
jgi:hypothetical protein